jgi:(p)ppGpp synthase/HD superfamily hydrolase
MEKTEYTKLRTKILGIIEGLTLSNSHYFNVRRAIIYAESIHKNTRRDGTPEFSHQLEMLSIALSLHNSLIDPYSVYMAIIVHDTIEDYPETQPALQDMFPDAIQFSHRLAKFKDFSHDEDLYYGYFERLAECNVCSVVKLIDRIHNLSTAVGVFSNEKLSEYCNEVEKYFLDMMHTAKSNFNQREVYEVLKFMLLTELRIIRKFLAIIDEEQAERQKTFTAEQLVNRLKGI